MESTPPLAGTPGLLCRIATLDVLQAECTEQPNATNFTCHLLVRCKDGHQQLFESQGGDQQSAIAGTLSELTTRQVSVTTIRCDQRLDGFHVSMMAREKAPAGSRAGVGRFVCDNASTARVVAALRAVSHAGLLKAAYRANNQKTLRGWSRQLVEEWHALQAESIDNESQRLEIEGLILEHFNRVASAAVVTATNHPRPDSILGLFDTSAWLFDAQGRRRDAYTDTDLWLAWYPGFDNDDERVNEVIDSLPAAPDSKIPWIVKLFENPTSWLRFRGAVDLEDHDVLHILLGRGLQDQDEAFVLGFAMGTAKRISWLQYWIFKLVLTYLYPEPYRIPHFLQPAFELGVQCGKETGTKNLYRTQLKRLRELTLGEARRQTGIDKSILRKYYELEQQQIPFTIASLRLP